MGANLPTVVLALTHSQAQQCVSPFYLDGAELNGRMRAILVDWLVQVHARFRLLQETLYMCVAVMDRYLQVSPGALLAGSFIICSHLCCSTTGVF